MLEYWKLWIGYLATGVDIVTAAVIGFAVVESLTRAAPLFVHRNASQTAKVELRLALGRWLAVGLELALAADILRTAVAPSWNDIGQLAAIAGLRTALNFFLAMEIDREEGRTSVKKAESAYSG